MNLRFPGIILLPKFLGRYSTIHVMFNLTKSRWTALTFFFLRLLQVANSKTLHLGTHPLPVFVPLKFQLGYRPAGWFAFGSAISVCLVLLPILRRTWKRRTTLPIQEQPAGHQSSGDKDLVDLHDVVVENAQQRSLEGSESLEEVKLSFGTDKPEVYLNMCAAFPVRKAQAMPLFRELFVSNEVKTAT